MAKEQCYCCGCSRNVHEYKQMMCESRLTEDRSGMRDVKLCDVCASSYAEKSFNYPSQVGDDAQMILVNQSINTNEILDYIDKATKKAPNA